MWDSPPESCDLLSELTFLPVLPSLEFCIFSVGQNNSLLAKQRVTSIFSTRASQIWVQILSSQTLEGQQRPSTARINELVKAGQEQPHSFAQYAVQIIPILSMLWYEKMLGSMWVRAYVTDSLAGCNLGLLVSHTRHISQDSIMRGCSIPKLSIITPWEWDISVIPVSPTGPSWNLALSWSSIQSLFC